MGNNYFKMLKYLLKIMFTRQTYIGATSAILFVLHLNYLLLGFYY